MGFCWFTLRALRSWKSFKTDSLVDESRALVVKLQALLFKRRQHGLEVAPAPSRGLYWREGEESGTHVVVVVKECMSVFLLQLSVATSERAMKVGLRSTVCLSMQERGNRTEQIRCGGFTLSRSWDILPCLWGSLLTITASMEFCYQNKAIQSINK